MTDRLAPPTRRRARGGVRAVLALAAGLVATGCMVGPGYLRPEVPTSPGWIESGNAALEAGSPDASPRWWDLFGDPVLSTLVDHAVSENLGLRAAGVRVVQAQARRGIAIGGLYPQGQALSGEATRVVLSENATRFPLASRSTNVFALGFDVAWEIDLWGKFRRAIEAADADLVGSIASYDAVLVSLVAEVATTYLLIRTVDERLEVASDNVRVQRESRDIARVRFEAGGTSELDVQQAESLLHETEATIPQLALVRRLAMDALCVLLGVPPQETLDLLGGPGPLPEAPVGVAVGVPAELLRRRPDVRSAERAAAAQSARIGVAAAELLPAFQLSGSVGLSATQAASLFEGRSFEAVAGPSFQWPVLQYGRLVNDVRLQDARFQEDLTIYRDTVLRAQQEVEDAIASFLRGREREQALVLAVEAAHRAVDLSLVQYREGAVDYTAVLNTQQAKVRVEDQYVNTRGVVVASVVELYRALGGGWEIREGKDFVPPEVRAQMEDRTRWGGLLAPGAAAADAEKARADEEKTRWWQWRFWWPKW